MRAFILTALGFLSMAARAELGESAAQAILRLGLPTARSDASPVASYSWNKDDLIIGIHFTGNQSTMESHYYVNGISKENIAKHLADAGPGKWRPGIEKRSFTNGSLYAEHDDYKLVVIVPPHNAKGSDHPSLSPIEARAARQQAAASAPMPRAR